MPHRQMSEERAAAEARLIRIMRELVGDTAERQPTEAEREALLALAERWRKEVAEDLQFREAMRAYMERVATNGLVM